MSVKILSESTFSRERTQVYQTLYKNFVVLIQQKKVGEIWTVYQHCLIPKLFINAIAALPNKTEPSESSIITSGGFLPPKTTPAIENPDVNTLTDEVKRIFYRYDCECIPLCENQLGVYRASDDLADMWGLKSTLESPDSNTPMSAPVTPAYDRNPSITPIPSPSLFAGLSYQRHFSVSNGEQPFDCNILPGTNFQTPQQTSENEFKTPQSSEKPKVGAAPKKRSPEQSLMDIFDC